MTKNSNRKGLALGAIFALVASLFVTAPAAQASEAGVVVAPIAGTSYTMVNTEDFILSTRLGSQVQADRASALKYIITKSGTVGYGLSISQTVSSTTLTGDFPVQAANFNAGNTYSSMITTSTVSVVAQVDATSSFGVFNQLRIQLWSQSALGIVSSSPATTVTVTAFLDLDNSGTINGTEPTTTVVISFVKTTAMGASVALTAPLVNDVRATASAGLTGINVEQLSGQFRLAFESTADLRTDYSDSSDSANVSPANLAEGNFSHSQTIAAASLSASISAVLYYGTPGVDTIVASSKLGVGAVAASELALSLVDSAHALSTSQHVRPNQTYTVRVHAKSAGVSASDVPVIITFTGSTPPVTGSKTVSINGGSELTTYPTSVTVTTGVDGFASWTMKTTGFAVGDDIDIQATVGNLTASPALRLVMTAPVFSIENDFARYATAPGTAVNLTYSVKDQFGELATRSDLRIQVTRGGTGFAYAETVSNVPVVAGKATFAFTPAAATTTGSASVSARLQRLNSDSNVWEAEANTSNPDDALIRVSSIASTFSARSVVSQSASVSYFPDTVSFKTVTATVTGAGDSVVVTGPSALIFREGGTTATASGTITLRANGSGVVTLNVAALLEGSHTITFTVGAVSTTSLLVVDPASGSAGVKVAFDKSSIVSGETATITGKVTDANGNPVNTTNADGSTATVFVSYTGKGLPFNTGSVETDEKGEFKVNLLALAGDVGTGTLTATYRPAGAAVDTNNVTATQVITIAAPAAVAAPEINAVIGSFNGRWAVRVENAKGAAVSVKVGGRWVKYTSLNDNYLFSRKSRVGASVAVAVYVNGQLENVATITIK